MLLSILTPSDIFRLSVECIFDCQYKLGSGSAKPWDSNELGRWIRALSSFKDEDYAECGRSWAEVSYIINYARATKDAIDQLFQDDVDNPWVPIKMNQMTL
jgi:hypothetical protein